MNVESVKDHPELVDFVKSKINRISRDGAINVISLILTEQPIHASSICEKYQSLVRKNLALFDDKENMKLDEYKKLKIELHLKIKEVFKDEDTDESDESVQTKLIDGQYVVDKHSVYKDIRKMICDASGEINFKYDFNKNDLPLMKPRNIDSLQKCEIQIIQQGIKFDYPVEYQYTCPQCHTVTKKKVYETVSTASKIKCEGTYRYMSPSSGEEKAKICQQTLAPDKHLSVAKDAYNFTIAYEDDNHQVHSANSISFVNYEPGYYECVMFKLKNPFDKDMFHIIDIKPIENKDCVLPELNPQENYLFTLQKFFDIYIFKQTGMFIHGLVPIKIALIVQKLFHSLKRRLIANIQVVGSASTGKTTVLKYYGFLLYSNLNLMSNGMSISVPSMRGTKQTISLMGKDVKTISKGLLGSYYNIHIDEAGENKELVQNLKSFLLEDNYSYNKAESDGVSNIRTCHVTISQNLDNNHVGQYRGSIRKAYKELDEVDIDGKHKDAWDENWDLHMPLWKYTDNPHLLKIIKEKRMEFQQKEQFWIDGYDYALHERFPFYFYLVNINPNKELDEVIRGNVTRDVISENLKIIRALKTNDINKYFEGLNGYIFSEHDIDNLRKIDDILLSYDIQTDARGKIFYYELVRMSRIINKRMEITDVDFELLKWFIENCNCKLDVTQTVTYKPTGPPDMQKTIEVEQKIEETQTLTSLFNIPEGEFE